MITAPRTAPAPATPPCCWRSPRSPPPQALAKSLLRSPRHINAARTSEPAVFPKHHLPKSSVDIDANPRRIRTSSQRHDGSRGRHDNYGFALSARPGESQRRPANNSSSRLMVWIGLPAPSCSRCLCPDGRTIRHDFEHRGRTLAPRLTIRWSAFCARSGGAPVWSAHSRTRQSALDLAAARLRHIAGTASSTERYLNIELLKDQHMRGAITA